MIILLFSLYIVRLIQSFEFKELCQKGLIKSCYNTEFFNELIPTNHSDYICDRMLFWTDEINENIQTSLTLAIIVLQLEGATESQTTDCKLNHLNKYNLTVRLKFGDFEFLGNDSYDLSVDDENVYHDIGSVETQYEDKVFMKQILDDLAGRYIVNVPVPVGKTNLFIDVEYVHPQGRYDCRMRIMVYSCWIRFLLIKVIGAVVGGVFLLSAIVCCPLVVLVCALLYCKFKKMRTKKK